MFIQLSIIQYINILYFKTFSPKVYVSYPFSDTNKRTMYNLYMEEDPKAHYGPLKYKYRNVFYMFSIFSKLTV